MNVADLLVAVAAGVFGFAIAPVAAKAIRETPPDPEDDPQPVPRFWPWLEGRKLLAPMLALVGFAVGLATGAEWVAAAHVVAALGLVTLSVIDLDLYLLPKRIVFPVMFATGALLGVSALAEGDVEPLKRAVICAFGAFGFLAILWIISPRGMGYGDVRLAGLIGLDLGWLGVRQVVLGIFAGFFFGSVVGIGLMIAQRKKAKDPVPFGPFLAAGTLFILFGGDLLFGLVRS